MQQQPSRARATVTIDILTPEQLVWLSDHVGRGEFQSVEDAARQLIDESMAFCDSVAADDLAWAKPLVDEALAAVERGEILTLAEHEARMDSLLALMKG